MRLFYVLCVLVIIFNLIINGNCSTKNFPSQWRRIFMTKSAIRELFTNTVNDGYCIVLYNNNLFNIIIWKIIFCPKFVIDNEFNRRQLKVTDTDYFYNNLDYDDLGDLALEYPADLVKLRKSCDPNEDDGLLVESNNCLPPEWRNDELFSNIRPEVLNRLTFINKSKKQNESIIN